MAKKKNIKLKGSSLFKKNKPLNKLNKTTTKINSKTNSISKRKPLNKIEKNKKPVKKNNTRPYSNIPKTPSSNKYLPDIVEKRYLFIGIIIVFTAWLSTNNL